MGCDIHFYVEKFEGGNWTPADKWVDEKPFEGDPPRKTVEYKDSFYHDRNYDLFAILADVRNGYGFAGVDTGDGFKPIAAPRGLPADVTALVKAENDNWGCDGHSHSHFTLAELLAYDWTQTTKHRGWVNGLQFWDWSRWRNERGEGPERYCGGISGPQIEHITVQEMQRRVDEITSNPNFRALNYKEAEVYLEAKLGKFYCNVEWEEPYYKSCRNFLGETLPRLLRLGKHDEVRIVFWFDN